LWFFVLEMMVNFVDKSILSSNWMCRYWDLVWSAPGIKGYFDVYANTTCLTVILAILSVQFWLRIWSKSELKILWFRINGTCFEVIVQNEDQVELSFKRMWDHSLEGKFVPLNIDKR
jgi:hypothetical protein